MKVFNICLYNNRRFDFCDKFRVENAFGHSVSLRHHPCPVVFLDEYPFFLFHLFFLSPSLYIYYLCLHTHSRSDKHLRSCIQFSTPDENPRNIFFLGFSPSPFHISFFFLSLILSFALSYTHLHIYRERDGESI